MAMQNPGLKIRLLRILLFPQENNRTASNLIHKKLQVFEAAWYLELNNIRLVFWKSVHFAEAVLGIWKPIKFN